jgi:UDP-N-acetyl-2-amino-2-deoxyglucuronate dehydrogenase
VTKVRFGLIGSGYINRGYAAGLHIGQVPDGELVAIAGGRRAPALAAEFGTEAEPTVETLIARPDIDAVIIGSPHTAHLPQTRMAAAAGKHVYTEKPMAVTVAECDAMIDACRTAGVKLGVNKVLRFRIAPKAAKELIDDGVIGDVRMIQARGSWTEFFLNDVVGDDGRIIVPAKPWAMDPKEGSQYLDYGVHCNDIIRWYSGSEAALCFARYRTYGTPPPPDLTAVVTYEMQNGVIATVLMTYELPAPGISPADVTFTIGSKGMIDCDQYGAVRYTTGGEWKLYKEQPAFDFLKDYLDPNRLLGFSAQVQDFARAIIDDREPAVTGWDGRQAVEMANAADVSAATGEAVRLPLSASPTGHHHAAAQPA